MKQHLMAMIKRGIRPSASGNPPILHANTKLGTTSISDIATSASSSSKVYKVVIAGATNAAANAFAFENPLGVEAVVGLTVLAVETGVTTLTIDIGTDADGLGTSDNLLNAAGIGTAQAATIQENVNNGGTNGKAAQILGADEFITGTASNTATALEAAVYITLTPVTA